MAARTVLGTTLGHRTGRWTPPGTRFVVAALALLGVGAPDAAQGARRVRAVAAPASLTAPAAVITLERTACHGQCAEYRLSFFEDGQVVYEGKANVSKAGRWHAAVPRRTVAELVAEFQRIGFPSFDSSYPRGLTESSIAITSLRVGDQVKTVTHDLGSPFPPAALATLEDRLDAAVQQVTWER